MRHRSFFSVLAAAWALMAGCGDTFGGTAARGDLVIVVGAAGEAEFGESFQNAAKLMAVHGEKARWRTSVIGLDPKPGSVSSKRALESALSALAGDADTPLWLVMLGHGTHDGRTTRFNLEGPDVSSDELAAWLKPVKRPICVINTAPASAPFVKALSGTNRVIVTATRTGQERNATRFGSHFPRALSDLRSDRDKDGRVSLLEAFLAAVAAVEEEYRAAGRLAAEHALLDDNGDGLGTSASKFKGVRPAKPGKDEVLDGAVAHRMFFFPVDEADALPDAVKRELALIESEVEALRLRKATFKNEEAYLDALEEALLRLARLSQGAKPLTPVPAIRADPSSNSPAIPQPAKDPSRKD